MANTDDANLSELLDDDKLPEEYPPERLLGADSYGVTAAEEEIDEPIEERLRREEPDFGSDDFPPLDQPVGRLVAPDAGGFDDEADAVASEGFGAGEGEGEGDLSAEEAAMHITADPPMGDGGDGYIEQ
jgi:hypothetical protein